VAKQAKNVTFLTTGLVGRVFDFVCRWVWDSARLPYSGRSVEHRKAVAFVLSIIVFTVHI